LCPAALAIAALAVYANHFENGFHFDDSHTVTDNVFIRDLHNVPRFFADAAYFSTLPDHQMYRPLVSTSLALDYWLGHGLKPFWFQLSTFVWFAVQLVLMFWLFRRIMDVASPHPYNLWAAFLAALCYGLHPANAETVNYVIQRADVYSTLGIVAGLLCFAAWPQQRKFGWFLIPVVLGCLAKPTALVFPAILLLYVFLFERQGTILNGNRPEESGNWRAALRSVLPALGVTAVLAGIHVRMSPPSFHPGAASAWLYRITQPYVAVYYFKSLFLPTELSADTDWGYVRGPLSTNAVIGFVFVAALLAAARWASRRRETRPIAFGLLWFFVAMLPTSLMPLAEVTNDHRMFFPFVGLVLAAIWGLRLTVAAHPNWLRGSLAALALVLSAEAVGTYQRNQVWRTEESLWRDVTEKSPQNGRGLMNYGLTLMARGDSAGALSYFERAAVYTPNYSTLEINLGIANSALHRDAEAKRHFERAIGLAPETAGPYFYYGRWFHESGQLPQSVALVEVALAKNRLYFDARHLLLDLYAERNDQTAVQRLARETLQLAPNDEVARRYAFWRAASAAASAHAPASAAPATPGQFLNQSLAFYESKQYFECILSAMKALKLKPDFPEAYNNIAAANNAMGRWDEGIRAAREALRLNPNFVLARNNLQWALQGKQNTGR
jgi:tetratricopeptide (TPR) repeat protein